MKKLAIIGSGDLGEQIVYHSLNDKHYIPVGFFDDFQSQGEIKHNLPILGGVEDILKSYKDGIFDFLMIGIGYKHFSIREEYFNRFFHSKIPFATIIHSSAYIDSSARIGQGVFIYPGCILDMNVLIEDNVLLNTGCIIAHDSIIRKHSFISPAVKIAGYCDIGECVNLGIGSVVIDNIIIKSQIKTGAGAVIVDNLMESGLYLGVPAKYKGK